MEHGKLNVNFDFSVIISIDIDLMKKLHGIDYLKYVKESAYEFGTETYQFINKHPLVKSCELDITEDTK